MATNSVDDMTFKGRDFLAVVDWYSKYPEVALLEGKTAACVIKSSQVDVRKVMESPKNC